MHRRQLLKGLFALPLFGLFKVAESRATQFITSINPPDPCPPLLEDVKVTPIKLSDLKIDESVNIRKYEYAGHPDQIVPGLHRIETRVMDYSKQLAMILKKNPTMTVRELAAKLCKSYAWLQDRLSLLNIDEKYHGIINEGLISLSNAYALAKITKNSQWAYIQDAQTRTPSAFFEHTMKHRKFVRENGPAEVVAKSVDQRSTTRYFQTETHLHPVLVAHELDYKEAKNLNFAKAYGSNMPELQTFSPTC